MEHILKKYLSKVDFDSYEDFKKNFKLNIPENFNFGFDVVDEWARVEPDKKALIWVNDRAEKKNFTFTDISKLSNKCANYLKSIGIKKGSTVLCIAGRRWEFWIIAVALHKIGAILIPGTKLLTTNDIVYRINDAKIDAIACVNEDTVVYAVDDAVAKAPIKKKILFGDGDRIGWDLLKTEMDKFPDTFNRPTGADATTKHDTMIVYFTSGTAGEPKPVMHSFAYPMGLQSGSRYMLQMQENKIHMSFSDTGWAMFAWGEIYGPWPNGTCVFEYDEDKFTPSHLLRMLQDYKLTSFCASPTVYRFMLQEDMTKYDLSSIQTYCAAGEPLNPEVNHKWQEITGHEIREFFGQTETTMLIGTFKWCKPVAGSLGKAAPLYDIKLIKEDGTEAKVGEEGSIVLSNLKENYPEGLSIGYYNRPQLTEIAMGRGSYDLHDCAYIDEDGYFHFIGRNDDVIKSSGYRISPFEVESAILEHPACVECGVTAVPDPIRGEIVKATIVLKKGVKPTPELKREIQNHVKHSTAPYKYPRIIEFVDALPKNLAGKIKRAQIRKNDAQKN